MPIAAQAEQRRATETCAAPVAAVAQRALLCSLQLVPLLVQLALDLQGVQRCVLEGLDSNVGTAAPSNPGSGGGGGRQAAAAAAVNPAPRLGSLTQRVACCPSSCVFSSRFCPCLQSRSVLRPAAEASSASVATAEPSLQACHSQ